MNWLQFLLWVAGTYVVYYFALVIFDLARAGRTPAGQQAANELTFSENVSPTPLQHQGGTATALSAELPASERMDPKGEPEVIGSGGVGFSELFRMAKQEAIIYTQSVSF